MSYTDYLKRMAINSPRVIDTQMRMPDASSFTWRTKMVATQVNRRSDHVINNSQDLGIAPRLFSPQVMAYAGTGFGGKVQDASSFTLSRSATATGRDRFRAEDGSRRIQTVPVNTSGACLATTPASQVVSEFGNSDRNISGLNMGYTAQAVNGGRITNTVGVCTQRFFPQTKSYFVDTLPDLKTHKIGSAPQVAQAGGGRQVVQNEIKCTTTNTSGVVKVDTNDANGVGLQNPKADIPFNGYSPPPTNYVGSYANAVHGPFITGIQGPQVGGQNNGGVRADKVGGATPMIQRTIMHRGWGGRTRNPYPSARVPPRGAPAQLKINDPNHYKV